MLLSDTDIKETIRELLSKRNEPRRPRHRCSNSHYVVALLSCLNEFFRKDGSPTRLALTLRNPSDWVDGSRRMHLVLRFINSRCKPVPLFRHHVDNNRTFIVPGITQSVVKRI